MLIVAAPKSASTSLMVTLGRRNELPFQQETNLPGAVPSELDILARYHSDIRELSEEQARRFTDAGSLHKQHVPPTKNNLGLLRGQPTIVLLRAPEEIVGAYHRAEQKGLHSPRPEFSGVSSEQQWFERSREIGLSVEAEWFVERWRAVAAERPEVLLVEFAELLERPDQTVHRIERHFGLEPSMAPVVLAKKRYSGSKRQKQRQEPETTQKAPAPRTSSQRKKRSLLSRASRTVRTWFS